MPIAAIEQQLICANINDRRAGNDSSGNNAYG